MVPPGNIQNGGRMVPPGNIQTVPRMQTIPEQNETKYGGYIAPGQTIPQYGGRMVPAGNIQPIPQYGMVGLPWGQYDQTQPEMGSFFGAHGLLYHSTQGARASHTTYIESNKEEEEMSYNGNRDHTNWLPWSHYDQIQPEMRYTENRDRMIPQERGVQQTVGLPWGQYGQTRLGYPLITQQAHTPYRRTLRDITT
jgi:hypothetical protein